MNVLLLENFQVEVDSEIRSKVGSMSLEESEIIALVGKNGSGKSTLLSGVMTLAGHYTTGRCLYLGTPIEDTTLDEKARQGAIYIAQKQPEIEGLSLIQLLYGMHTRSTSTPLSILDYKNELTLKLEKYSLRSELLLRPVGAGLSGGEKKHSELITLIATEPKLALIDEIDSGVDIGTIETICEVLKDLRDNGCSILIVSHNFDLLQKIQPKKIYLAKEGTISYYGSLEDLGLLKENGFAK